MLGDRFGIVAFNPSLFPLWVQQVRDYRLEGRSVPIVDVGLTYEQVLNGFQRPDEVIAAFTKAARRSLDLGADVLIPGQSLLGEVLVSNGVRRIDGGPVIDPLAVTVNPGRGTR